MDHVALPWEHSCLLGLRAQELRVELDDRGHAGDEAGEPVSSKPLPDSTDHAIDQTNTGDGPATQGEELVRIRVGKASPSQPLPEPMLRDVGHPWQPTGQQCDRRGDRLGSTGTGGPAGTRDTRPRRWSDRPNRASDHEAAGSDHPTSGTRGSFGPMGPGREPAGAGQDEYLEPSTPELLNNVASNSIRSRLRHRGEAVRDDHDPRWLPAVAAVPGSRSPSRAGVGHRLLAEVREPLAQDTDVSLGDHRLTAPAMRPAGTAPRTRSTTRRAATSHLGSRRRVRSLRAWQVSPVTADLVATTGLAIAHACSRVVFAPVPRRAGTTTTLELA